MEWPPTVTSQHLPAVPRAKKNMFTPSTSNLLHWSLRCLHVPGRRGQTSDDVIKTSKLIKIIRHFLSCPFFLSFHHFPCCSVPALHNCFRTLRSSVFSFTQRSCNSTISSRVCRPQILAPLLMPSSGHLSKIAFPQHSHIFQICSNFKYVFRFYISEIMHRFQWAEIQTYQSNQGSCKLNTQLSTP